ncbi:hypothetical protein Mal52_50310 [Symmachiella dynata]|uniref:Uncharacterized protein n=1 Tax=Symmachiella dynata TaxID=2527995 RepID=A0A517ZVM3_9PLAN|nr:hypothetical protein [Symmachiella dynata]QDU46510.1 hypothetical protein Mal52_50310 [Symmachiella dynata]
MSQGEVYRCAFCRETLSAGDAFVSEMDELEWLEQFELDSPDIDVDFLKQEYGPLRVCRKCRDSIETNFEDLDAVEYDSYGDRRMAIRLGIAGVLIFSLLVVVVIIFSLFEN